MLMLGLRPSGLIPPAASVWLQLMIYGCPLTVFKWLRSQEHLLCGRASGHVCRDIWSESSGDRLGLRRDRHLEFCCLRKARLPINSSESKQTFCLEKCGTVLGSGGASGLQGCCTLSYSGSDGGRGDRKSRPVLLKLEGLMKIRIAGPTPRISDSADLGWGADNGYFSQIPR